MAASNTKQRPQVILVAPSLDVARNVGGVAAVAQMLVSHNETVEYVHFRQGLTDEARQGWRKYVLTVWAFWRWVAFLFRYRKAVIHYHFPLSRNGILRDFWFIMYARMLRRPMVVHLHGGLYLSANQKPFPVKQMLRRIFSLRVPFIVLSEKEAQVLRTAYDIQQVNILPNVVDTEDAARYERTNGESTPLKILYLGRIEADKGMDYALAAMQTLKERGVDFQMVVAGREQGSQAYLRRFAESLGAQFSYQGIVSGERKNELLRECHVFLLPSFYEGLPMSLLETMSYGEVPVVTAVGSMTEVVVDGRNGLLVKVKDSASIVDAIEKLYHDRNLLKTLSAQARQTVMEQFRVDGYMEKLNHIYQQIALKGI